MKVSQQLQTTVTQDTLHGFAWICAQGTHTTKAQNRHTRVRTGLVLWCPKRVFVLTAHAAYGLRTGSHTAQHYQWHYQWHGRMSALRTKGR